MTTTATPIYDPTVALPDNDLPLRKSRLLAAARSGRPAATLKLNFADPRVVEIAALARPDAIWLCNEHVPNDWLNLENQIRAARIYGIDTIVRVEKGSYSDLIKPFEAGASGIMVPHVTHAGEARKLVSRLRFQPLGSRPLDGGGIDGAFCQLPLHDYLRHANQEQFVIFQIESPEAVAHVEAIAAVPGFDILLFGAGDFAHLIGHPGEQEHPEVIAARQRIGAAARQHGKFAMLAGIPASLESLRAEGYSIFNTGADVIGLATYFKASVGKVPFLFS
ncbi:MAG TPA: aldolase/citrate lyase family protein [Chthoniobacteraceae bacterium]|nr:aldolase/citrate lyase family protein [Chthoniobacteraceae bacterium]